MALDPHDLPNAALDFLTERHLATLTTLRPDGTPHVVPIGFTFDPATATARVITSSGSRKVANAAATSRAVLCQVEGWRWLSLEGQATVRREPEVVAEAEARYAERYREPRPNPERVVIEIAVDKVLGLVQRPSTL